MTNPNGANQYQMDPRQKLCWESYVDPRSETFGNGTQSAIKAGYEPDYADQITTVEWFKGKVRRLNLLSKAEKVLDDTLETIHINEEGRVDSSILRVKTDVAKFVASTQGKDEGYTTKTETDITTQGERIVMSPEKVAIAKEYEEKLKENL